MEEFFAKSAQGEEFIEWAELDVYVRDLDDQVIGGLIADMALRANLPLPRVHEWQPNRSKRRICGEFCTLPALFLTTIFNS